MDNFFRRTLTGAAIVIFILGGFWLHPVSFFAAGAILVAVLLYEYYSMITLSGIVPQSFMGISTGVAAYTISTLTASKILELKWLLLVFLFFTLILITELYRNKSRPFDSLAHTFFGLIYVVLPFCLFPFSAFFHEGIETLIPHGNYLFSPGIVIGFFILVWANDTGAYLSGITLGKHRLFERISPKKSWEGFFGGMLTAALAAWLLSGWLGVTGKIQWVIISLIVSIAGTYGDLAESLLKRSIGVKDSGSILPGHGGFLDRFDSTILSFPLVYLFLVLFA